MNQFKPSQARILFLLFVFRYDKRYVSLSHMTQWKEKKRIFQIARMTRGGFKLYFVNTLSPSSCCCCRYDRHLCRENLHVSFVFGIFNTTVEGKFWSSIHSLSHTPAPPCPLPLRLCVCMCLCTFMCGCASMCVCVCVSACMCLCACMCVSVCVCVRGRT